MFKTVRGQDGRLLYQYDVITDFDGWVAIPFWNGSPDAQDTRAGATLNVDRHYPDILAWGYRDRGELRVELDIGKNTFSGPARIVTEEPLLTVEIIGALERQ
jgi:hypothetical protein